MSQSAIMHNQAKQAYDIIRDFGWDISWKDPRPVPDDAWPIDIIAKAISDAVSVERERCAKISEGIDLPGEPSQSDAVILSKSTLGQICDGACAATSCEIAAAIREENA